MAVKVERVGDAWSATYLMGGRSLTMAMEFGVVPNEGAEVVVEKTKAASPFFSQSRIVAEAMQGVGQALAEARVQWWVKRIVLRDCDAPAPAQALYLACAIARAAVAAEG